MASALKLIAAADAEASTAAEPKGRVLVCDDSATIRASIEAMLAPRYECCLVVSAERALEVFDTFKPELVLTDLFMDGMTGLELCQRLRSDPQRAGVPIVLLTTLTDHDERARSLELGADDYLFKPVRERELVARVASLLRLRRATVALEARTQELERAQLELLDAQSVIVHTERLATLGTLAAGLAHEINNPLAFMKPGAEAIHQFLAELEATDRARFPGVSELVQVSAEVEQGIERIARVVRDLRDFAADKDTKAVEFLLRDEVERAWKMVLMHAVSRAELEIDVPEGLSLVALRTRLSHVLLNLFLNAVQVSGSHHCTLRVSARREPGWVVISVSDDGPPVPAALRTRVFEPFLAVRGHAAPAGLGLSVSHGIVHTLGGTLELEPAEERGATFVLRLPAAPVRAPAG